MCAASCHFRHSFEYVRTCRTHTAKGKTGIEFDTNWNFISPFYIDTLSTWRDVKAQFQGILDNTCIKCGIKMGQGKSNVRANKSERKDNNKKAEYQILPTKKNNNKREDKICSWCTSLSTVYFKRWNFAKKLKNKSYDSATKKENLITVDLALTFNHEDKTNNMPVKLSESRLTVVDLRCPPKFQFTSFSMSLTRFNHCKRQKKTDCVEANWKFE